MGYASFDRPHAPRGHASGDAPRHDFKSGRRAPRAAFPRRAWERSARSANSAGSDPATASRTLEFPCGSWLACDSGVSASHLLPDPPLSRASPAPTGVMRRLIVPTLRVGMHLETLRVTTLRADAERPGRHSHAERGNDQQTARVLIRLLPQEHWSSHVGAGLPAIAAYQPAIYCLTLRYRGQARLPQGLCVV